MGEKVLCPDLHIECVALIEIQELSEGVRDDQTGLAVLQCLQVVLNHPKAAQLKTQFCQFFKLIQKTTKSFSFRALNSPLVYVKFTSM